MVYNSGIKITMACPEQPLIFVNNLFIIDYLESTSATSPVNLSASGDVNLIQIINCNNIDNGCISSNISTYGGCNSPYKVQRQLTTGRERKRVVRSAPNG